MYIVDHPDFRKFINTLNPQYRLAYKKRLTHTLIPKVYAQVELKVKEEISSVETTTLASDAWTDDRMKAFLANSSSIIDKDWQYKTYLMACNRIKGRHTADNIFDKYKEITNKFKVNGKVTHNVTDAAANMKKALCKTSFLNKQVRDGIICEYNSQSEKSSIITVEEEEEEEDDFQTENATLNDADDFCSNSQATHESDSESTAKTLTNGSKEASDIFFNVFDDDDCPERLNCVIHQLQIVIKESKTDCRGVERCVEHVATYVAKASSSYLIKDKIELLNGFLGKRCAPRWNSEHNMVRSFLKFSDQQLNEIYGEEEVLTFAQRQTCEEFVSVLEPFLEATLVLQKEAFSIGHVLPSYRGMQFIYKIQFEFYFLNI